MKINESKELEALVAAVDLKETDCDCDYYDILLPECSCAEEQEHAMHSNFEDGIDLAIEAINAGKEIWKIRIRGTEDALWFIGSFEEVKARINACRT